MSVIAGGVTLNAAQLRSIILLGGDTNSAITAGDEADAASRGQHLLVRYVAPLNKYYENWHGRVVHTLSARADASIAALQSQTAAVLAGSAEDLNTIVPDVWDNVGATLLEYNTTVGLPAGLPDADKRFRLAHASSRVLVGAMSMEQHSARQRIDYDDARSSRDKVISVFSASGQTAVDTVGQSVEYTSQLVQLKEANYQYLEQSARFQADKDVYKRQQKAESSSGWGTALGIIGAFF